MPKIDLSRVTHRESEKLKNRGVMSEASERTQHESDLPPLEKNFSYVPPASSDNHVQSMIDDSARMSNHEE